MLKLGIDIEKTNKFMQLYALLYQRFVVHKIFCVNGE